MILHVKKLNNGQSKVWLNTEAKHTVATNAIRNIFVARGDTEEARAFGAKCIQLPLDEEASFEGQNIAEIATELGLVALAADSGSK